jgi:hypothetical protein
MNVDPAKLSLSNFLGGESDDPLQPPPSFTNWMQLGAWAVELYEPELLSTADARTTILVLRTTPTFWLPRTRRCAPMVWAHAVRPCYRA